MRTPVKSALFTLLLALSAAAAASPPPVAGERYGTDTLFAKLDGNDNGILDRSEAARWKPLAADFAQADRNHDLQISRGEFEAYRARRLAARPPGPMPRNAIFPDTGQTAAQGRSGEPQAASD